MTVKSQKSDTSELVIFTLFLTAGFLEMLQKFPLKKKKILKKRSAQSRFWIKISSWGRLCDIACHLVMSAVKYKCIHNDWCRVTTQPTRTSKWQKSNSATQTWARVLHCPTPTFLQMLQTEGELILHQTASTHSNVSHPLCSVDSVCWLHPLTGATLGSL